MQREKVQMVLEAEWQFQFQFLKDVLLLTDIEHAFCKIEDAIPCIMHGEKRMGEKICMMMVLQGWNECLRMAEKKELKGPIEQIINMQAFGTPASALQWTLPTSKDGSKIDAIWCIRKVVQQMKPVLCNNLRCDPASKMASDA